MLTPPPHESPSPATPNGAHPTGSTPQIRFIPLSYSSEDSQGSALRLITALRPDWQDAQSDISFARFTDGITNTLLKATNRRPGMTAADADADAILLRAYGHGTDLIIDRLRETQNHELLSGFGLAPKLYARFQNGMLYRFIRGSVTHPDDLRRPEIYRAVARRLAEWHAVVPCLPDTAGPSKSDGTTAPASVAPSKPSPNAWTVMQKWILSLPTETDAQRARQKTLQEELTKLVAELGDRDGLGKNGLVFAHCDLLSGNIIVLPNSGTGGVEGSSPGTSSDAVTSVAFIDYEYATPSPAAFDLANHFAEWGGFDCDYSVLPTRAQRADFIREYVRAYFRFLPQPQGGAVDLEGEASRLLDEVDVFRGMPGLYWGIWSLIQATISEIDFDYASYAETRLGEYWAWRAEVDGSRQTAGKEMTLRERRWAQEE